MAGLNDTEPLSSASPTCNGDNIGPAGQQDFTQRVLALEHLTECSDSSICRVRHCSAVRVLKSHVDNASGYHGKCTLCKAFGKLCLGHVVKCSKNNCDVAYCNLLKVRTSINTSLERPTPEEIEEYARAFQDSCKKAAEVIHNADFLLVATGAGWSADSGLSTYTDIANIQAYEDMGLTYRDLCVPKWIENDPAIFYGFWGSCFNDYRETEPHKGYYIIKRWKDHQFSDRNLWGSKLLEEVLKEIRELKATSEQYDSINSNSEGEGEGEDEGNSEDRSGPEGTTEEALDQEVHPSVSREKKRPLLDHVSIVSSPNKKTKLGTMSDSAVENDEKSVEDSPPVTSPHVKSPPPTNAFYCLTSNVDAHFAKAGFLESEIHEIHGNTETWQCANHCTGSTWSLPVGQRFHINKDNMRSEGASDILLDDGTFADCKFPKCPQCGGLARPAVLFFEDIDFIENIDGLERFEEWESAVLMLCRTRNLKLAILEVGCGNRVPSIRRITEHLISKLGKNANLIRINLDYPRVPMKFEDQSICIMSKGLNALNIIDDFYSSMEPRPIPSTPPTVTPLSPTLSVSSDDGYVCVDDTDSEEEAEGYYDPEWVGRENKR